MATVISVIILFCIVAILPLIEKYMGKLKLPIYIIVGLIMILVAGFREVGADPDSNSYDEAYRNYYSRSSEFTKEPTFIWMSAALNQVTSDVHALFLAYAFLAVVMHFVAFRKLSELWFLPVLVYASFYFEMHEMIQIRTGVLSGLFMLAIKPMAERRWLTALLLILIGTTFHVSGLALLPLLFLTNKPMGKMSKWIWGMVIPIGYIVYFMGMAVTMYIDIPFIGEKLMEYQSGDEKGQGIVNVYAFNYIQLFSILAFYYLLYFYDTVAAHNKYFPLMMKIFAIGTAIYAGFSFFPVVGDRIGYQIKMVNIILYANIYYTLRPKWAGILAVFLVCCVHMYYITIYTFFWT